MDLNRFVSTKFVLTLIFLAGIDVIMIMLIYFGQTALIERFLLELLGLQAAALGGYTWANIQEKKNGNGKPEIPTEEETKTVEVK